MVEALQHSAHAIGEKFGTKVADNFYHVPIDKKALLSLASALFSTVVLFRWSVSKDFGHKLQRTPIMFLPVKEALLSLAFSLNLDSCLAQVVMDEPCAVHYVGILQTRDASFPTSAEVYNYTGLDGLSSDFNGTINVTQAGIPFSSGQCGPLVTPSKIYAWHISQDLKAFLFSCDIPLQSSRLPQVAPA